MFKFETVVKGVRRAKMCKSHSSSVKRKIAYKICTEKVTFFFQKLQTIVVYIYTEYVSVFKVKISKKSVFFLSTLIVLLGEKNKENLFFYRGKPPLLSTWDGISLFTFFSTWQVFSKAWSCFFVKNTIFRFFLTSHDLAEISLLILLNQKKHVFYDILYFRESFGSKIHNILYFLFFLKIGVFFSARCTRSYPWKSQNWIDFLICFIYFKEIQV